nr:immunoglobulin light chain junction region [Macaca mulatta]
CMQGLEFSYSF